MQGLYIATYLTLHLYIYLYSACTCTLKCVMCIYPLGQVTQNESIFTYKQPQSVSDPNHTPPFLDEILSNLMGNSTLMGVCGSNAECLFDFGQTGNAEVGMAAMTVENEAAIEAQEACK